MKAGNFLLGSVCKSHLYFALSRQHCPDSVCLRQTSWRKTVVRTTSQNAVRVKTRDVVHKKRVGTHPKISHFQVKEVWKRSQKSKHFHNLHIYTWVLRKRSLVIYSFMRRLEPHTGNLSEKHIFKSASSERSVGAPFPPRYTPLVKTNRIC